MSDAMTPCDETQARLSELLNGGLDDAEAKAAEAHLAGCADCRKAAAELRWMVGLLHGLPAESPPPELAARIKGALAALPDEAPARRAGWLRRLNVPSAIGGAAAAAAFAFLIWNAQPPAGLPRIETAAVSLQTDVAVNIGFDVGTSVEDVTFQIDLPEGLRFVDDAEQPLVAQSVSWRGSLKEGKTVVPIVVRGVQPGRWEIQATVRKGEIFRKTTIVLPVEQS